MSRTAEAPYLTFKQASTFPIPDTSSLARGDQHLEWWKANLHSRAQSPSIRPCGPLPNSLDHPESIISLDMGADAHMPPDTCRLCGASTDLEWVHDPEVYDIVCVCGDCRKKDASMIPIR